MKGLQDISEVKKRLGLLKHYSRTELAHAFGVRQCWVTRKISALHESDYYRRDVPGSVAWELYLTYLFQRQLRELEGRDRIGKVELRAFFDKFDLQSDVKAAQKEYAEAMGGSWEHFNGLLTSIEIDRANKLPTQMVNVDFVAA